MEEASTCHLLCRYDLGGLVQQYGSRVLGLGVSKAIHRSKVSICNYMNLSGLLLIWAQLWLLFLCW